MSTTSRIAVVSLVVSIAGASGVSRVHAQTRPVAVLSGTAETPGRPLAETSDFWRDLRAPGSARAHVLVRQARVLARHAGENRPDPRVPGQRGRPHLVAAYTESAIIRLEHAHRLRPDDPEILFLLARLLSSFERPRPGQEPERRIEDAIVRYEELRALDPDYAPSDVAGDLGVLYSRRDDDARAIEEYRRAIEVVGDFRPLSRSTLSSNLAESLMMVGSLREAIEFYERAIRAAELSQHQEASRSLFLAHFGLAVALDRHGDHRDALEHAAHARGIYGGAMDALTSDGVFFEPAPESHYYFALGHLAYAETQPGEERASHLRLAREAWADYLGLSAQDDPWRSLAEQHAREVDAQLVELARAAHRR